MKFLLKVPYSCLKLAIIVLLTSQALPSWSQVYNVKDFGAVADGSTMNTAAIQKAIDKCSNTGGRVLFPKGTFLSGTLYIKSNVNIHLEEGAVLLGSPHFKDYPSNTVRYKNAFTHFADGKPFANKAFLFAEAEHNISFTGTGTINGNGDAPEFNLGNDDTPQSRARPCMILFADCKNISLTDLHLTKSAYWLQNYLGCDGLHLKNLKIYNHANYNVDGIDIDAKNVLVEDCDIDVDDDGICMKSHDRNRPCENIVIRNCVVASNCNAIKFGTMSIGDLKNVSISNCTIKHASEDKIRHWKQTLEFIEDPITVISGISLEAVDGAVINDVRISDIRMTGVQTPLFIVLGNRARKQVGDIDPSPIGGIKNITISNITATSHSKMSSSINGLPGHYVENIKLNNIVLSNMGNGTLADAEKPFPENPQAYPENRMFGFTYPVSGFYIRHVKNMEISGLSLSVRNPDHRPALALDDVMGGKITGLKTPPPKGKNAAVSVINSGQIVVSKPEYNSNAQPFLQIKGKKTDVVVSGFKQYQGWLKMLPNK